MTTEPRDRRRRFLDSALAVALVSAILIEMTGGMVFEFLSFEITARSARGALLLFALLWLVRTIWFGSAKRAARSALVGLGWVLCVLLVVVLINWAASGLLRNGSDATMLPVVSKDQSGLPGSSDWNVLLISLDTLRPDHLGCYGYHRDTSPTIDRLASEGVVFRNQIAAAPDTLVSHASMLTSMNPTTHGARMYPPSPVREDALTLAEALKAEGFATAAITNGGQLDRTFNLGQGFDLYTDKGSTLKRMREHAQRWLGPRLDGRWFLFLHSYQTHLPYRPHQRFWFAEGYEGLLPPLITEGMARRINHGQMKIDADDLGYIEALYDGEIAFADDQLRQLFEALREMGVWERTLVIVTSDHGEEFGEHGNVATHSHTLYDELLKVPFVMRVPGQFEGVEVSRQTRGIDLAPTVLDALGIPIPDSMQGVSLLPRLDGREDGPGLPVVSERTAGKDLLSWRTEDAKLIYPKEFVGNESWLNRMAFSGSERHGEIEDDRALFLLEPDPGETEDVYASRAWWGRALLRDLVSVHSRDQAFAPPEASATVDDELRDRLEALGYVQ